MATEVYTAASPSLGLVKYWGKHDAALNTPATPSIGITLGGLETRTMVALADDEDSVLLDGKPQPPSRFAPFFDNLRQVLGRTARFQVESYNTFPTAAGLASSSSGFAALTLACVRAVGADLSPAELSSLALRGSASAARAVYGGFSLLPRSSGAARPLYSRDHWPNLRIVAVALTAEKKPVSSRDAMTRSRETSPFYAAWVEDAQTLASIAQEALDRRDIEVLGNAMRKSYLRMVSTMLSADPPVLYWLPAGLAVIRLCEDLRREGVPAWETMDAGPQVKIATLSRHVAEIRRRIAEIAPEARQIEAAAGDGARTISKQDYEAGLS